jgi:2-dehydropantoate 2-reductase
MVIGELDRATRDRTTRLVDALTAAGVTARASADIGLDLWRKFGLIVPMNIGSGLARGPIGLMLATERGRAIIAGALHEIVQVSRVAGTALSDDDETQIRGDLMALPPSTRPSFLADLERGGPTELDLLAGNVSRLGREHGVATPIHDVATAGFEAATARD